MGSNSDDAISNFDTIRVRKIISNDPTHKRIIIDGNILNPYCKIVSTKIQWYESITTNSQTKAEVGVHSTAVDPDKRYMRILGYKRPNGTKHLLLEGDEIRIKSKHTHTDGNISVGPNTGNVNTPPGTIVLSDIYLTSSLEFKENTETLSSKEAFNIIEKLEPVKFTFKNDPEKNLKMGFIAENVPDIASSKDHKNVKVMEIVSAMTKVVKEQQNTIESMSKEISELKKRINTNSG
jgi:hypothetical protein